MKWKHLLTVFIIAASIPAACSTEDYENVVTTRDVDYVAGTNYAEDRDKLDIFMPEDATGTPVIVFFHGGALQQGDKRHGEVLAMRFVPEGVGVVSANYRLSPGVMFPAHIQDAAAAFAWVIKNIEDYGGDPERVYVSGYSAGAYLATLMALDPAHLAAHGLGLNSIRGTIAISPFLYVEATAKSRPTTVWGDNPDAWMNASVTPHIEPGKGPMLLIYADGDAEWRRSQNDIFGQAMRAAGNSNISVVEVPNRDHIKLMTQMNAADDQIGKLVQRFIGERE